MLDIKKELSSNQTILLVMPGANYNQVIVDNMKKISGKSVCYVTLNKTAGALIELFKKKKINLDNVIFIDAISNTIKKIPEKSDRIYYVSSPGALTELSLAISKFLGHGFEFFVFDSLTSMTIYQKKSPVNRCVSSIINQIKIGDTKAIFYALKVDEQEAMIKETGMSVDKIIEFGKKGKE